MRNRSKLIVRVVLVFGLFLGMTACSGSAITEIETDPTYTGDVRELSAITGETDIAARAPVVYLPPGYDADTDRRYPVLYLHDGQNVFDARSVGTEWNMDETAQRLITSGAIEPVIIVGIPNSEHRIREYTPAEQDGGGPAYAKYVVERIKPVIDETFRTRPDAASNFVGGSSLGGLISMAITTWYPDVFGGALVVSPSVWWDGEVIVDMVKSGPAPGGRKIWLDMGTEEGEGAIGGARRLRDALVERGWVLGENLAYLEAEGAAHNERAWSGRAEAMLRFLFER